MSRDGARMGIVAAQRVLADLDRDYLAWLLARLVEFPSTSPPCRLGPIAAFVAGEFKGHGLRTFEARIEDGVMYGRGTADCKGSLAAMMAAMRQAARTALECARAPQ